MNLHSKSEEIIKENVNYLYNELESNKVKILFLQSLVVV